MHMFNKHIGRHYYRTSNPMQLIHLTQHSHTHTHTQRATSTQHIRQIVCNGHLACGCCGCCVTRSARTRDASTYARPRDAAMPTRRASDPLLLGQRSPPAAAAAAALRHSSGHSSMLSSRRTCNTGSTCSTCRRVLPAAASAGISDVRASRAAASP